MNSHAVREKECPPEDVFGKEESLCLKGIAILMLMVHHCFMSQGRYRKYDITFLIPEKVWLYVAQYFKICVCLFVFVSAYGMTKKLMKIPEEDSKKYYGQLANAAVSRLVRLLAGFIFVLLFVDVFTVFYDPGRFAEKYGTSLFGAVEYWLIDMFGLAELFGTPTFLGTYWYYSLAIVLILLVPVFYLMLRRMGAFLFLGLIAVLNFTLTFKNTNIEYYILAIAVSVVCARENLITRLVRHRFLKDPGKNRFLKLSVELILLFGLMCLYNGVLNHKLRPLWNGVIPPLLTAFFCEFIFGLKGIRQVLMFFGKYSANVFLVHSYIRHEWCRDFTYSFRYPLLIVTVLFTLSLALSLAIEGLKKLLRYQQAVNWLVQTLTDWNGRLLGEQEGKEYR